jgi:putative acetyltransferase
MIHCRDARPNEVEALYAIWEAAVQATHDFVSEADLAFYGGLLHRKYLPGGGFRVAVDANDKPVGFIEVTGGIINLLFVHPRWFGRGVGRALVAEAFAWDGPVTVDVNVQNMGARRFYERMGFVETGRSPVDGCGRPYPLIHLRSVASGGGNRG